MAKKLSQQKAPPKNTENEKAFEQKLFWFLVTAYIAKCAGLLDREKLAKLDQLGEQHGGGVPWEKHVEKDADIDQTFIRAVYKQCLKRKKAPSQAILFILRGLGCPDPEQRAQELL